MQPGQNGILRLVYPAADVLHPLQHKPVGVQLLLTEAVDFQAVHLMEQIRHLGPKPGRGDILRGGQIHLHDFFQKDRGLGLRPQGAHQLGVPAQIALDAIGIHGKTHSAPSCSSRIKSSGESMRSRYWLGVPKP